MLTDAFQLISW